MSYFKIHRFQKPQITKVSDFIYIRFQTYQISKISDFLNLNKIDKGFKISRLKKKICLNFPPKLLRNYISVHTSNSFSIFFKSSRAAAKRWCTFAWKSRQIATKKAKIVYKPGAQTNLFGRIPSISATIFAFFLNPTGCAGKICTL